MRFPVLALTILVLAGCGSSGADDSRAVKATLQTMVAAISHHDYHTLCTSVFAPSLLRPALAVGLSCEQALARGLGSTVSPSLRVRTVTVTGNRALARVATGAAGQQPREATIALSKISGRWLVSSLAG